MSSSNSTLSSLLSGNNQNDENENNANLIKDYGSYPSYNSRKYNSGVAADIFQSISQKINEMEKVACSDTTINEQYLQHNKILQEELEELKKMFRRQQNDEDETYGSESLSAYRKIIDDLNKKLKSLGDSLNDSKQNNKRLRSLLFDSSKSIPSKTHIAQLNEHINGLTSNISRMNEQNKILYSKLHDSVLLLSKINVMIEAGEINFKSRENKNKIIESYDQVLDFMQD